MPRYLTNLFLIPQCLSDMAHSTKKGLLNEKTSKFENIKSPIV